MLNEKKFFKLAKNLILKHNQECAKLDTQERYVACIDFGFIYYIIHHFSNIDMVHLHLVLDFL